MAQEKASRKSEVVHQRQPFKRFSEVMKNWLALFVEHYRQPVSELSAVAYSEGLSDLSAEELDAACREAIRTSEFMPVVATIRHALDKLQIEVDYVPPRTRYPEVTPEERSLTAEEEQELNELKAKIFNIGNKKTKSIAEQKNELREKGYLQ